jgi:hypothetical protein
VAQQKVLHMNVAAITGNPKIAEDLAPIEGAKGVSDATRDAEFAFPLLMRGLPVNMKQGLNPIDQIQTLEGLMAGEIAQFQKSGGVNDQRELSGLANVGQYIGGLIQLLSQDEANKAIAKQFSDALGKLMNEVKALAQQHAEKSQIEPKETIAIKFSELSKYVQDQIILANGFKPDPNPDALPPQQIQKLASKQVSDKQKLDHKNEAFVQQQARDNIKTVAEINRDATKAKHEEENKPEPVTTAE